MQGPSRRRARVLLGFALALLLPIASASLLDEVTDGVAATSGVLVLSIAVAALVGGLEAGMIASGVATLCALYFFVPPRHSFELSGPGETVGLLTQALSGLLVAGLVHLLEGARGRARDDAERVRRLNSLTGSLARLGPGDDLELECARHAVETTGAAWAEVQTGDGDDVVLVNHGREATDTDHLVEFDGDITIAGRGVRPCHYRFAFDRPVDHGTRVLLEAITQQCSSTLERLLFRRAELLEAREQELVTKAATLLSAAADPRSVADAVADLVVPEIADTCEVIARGAGGVVVAPPSPPNAPELRVPLVARGEVIADLIVTRNDGFDTIAQLLLVRFGDLVAQALDRARLFDQQRTTSMALQRSLLPSALLSVPGLDVAAEYVAIGGAEVEVGGDFYDSIRLDDGSVTLIIGDVQGKGIPAATLTALARQTLRAIAMRGLGPAEMLRDLNQALLYLQDEQTAAGDDDTMRLVTAAVAHVAPMGGDFVVTISCGGHPPPIIVRADGSVERPDALGTILGLQPDPILVEDRMRLGLADTLVLYTDGVTDVHNGVDFLGEADLARLIRNRIDLTTAPDIAAHIATTVQSVAVQDLRDDIAVLVARVTRETP